MNWAAIFLIIVLIGLCLFLVKKRSGGCCGMKKTDTPGEKKDSDKQGCCGGH